MTGLQQAPVLRATLRSARWKEPMRLLKQLSSALALTVLAAGCQESVTATNRAYIAPLDGQTGVPVDMALVVIVEGLGLPETYVMPDFISVVDFTDGGIVPGRIQILSDSVRFSPEVGWTEGHRYGWTVDPVESVAHGPQFALPDHLSGTAMFESSDALDLLGAVHDTDGETCLLMSRALTADDDGEFIVIADEQVLSDVVVSLESEANWGKPYQLEPGDPRASVLCLETEEFTFEPGVKLRVTFGDFGTWTAVIKDSTIADLVVDLRRGNY